MTDSLWTRIATFLREHDTVTLATIGEDGEPCAAAVFYAVDDRGRLVFVSDPATHHGSNLARDPRVAATIQADGQDWNAIHGVQITGTARVVDSTVADVFRARFPFVAQEGELRGALATTRCWRLTPDRIRLIDNRLGFGHAEVWCRES